MITIITGSPGIGKTVKAVTLMLAAEGKRPIYCHGIPDLVVDHLQTPPVEQWTRRRPSPDDSSIFVPVFAFPHDSLIVIDDAETIYSPRSDFLPVPDHISAFENVPQSMDFVLITQRIRSIHPLIRRYAGKHIELTSKP